MADTVNSTIQMLLAALEYVENPSLRFENRLSLQGYLNCARDTGAISQEEFEVYRQKADQFFDLQKYMLERMQQILKQILEVM